MKFSLVELAVQIRQEVLKIAKLLDGMPGYLKAISIARWGEGRMRMRVRVREGHVMPVLLKWGWGVARVII